MKNRNEKQQDLDKLKTELAKVSTVILSTFQGITVEDDTKLRRAVQAAGGKYKVDSYCTTTVPLITFPVMTYPSVKIRV